MGYIMNRFQLLPPDLTQAGSRLALSLCATSAVLRPLAVLHTQNRSQTGPDRVEPCESPLLAAETADYNAVWSIGNRVESP